MYNNIKNNIFVVLAVITIISCSDNKKRRGIDYNKIKPELALTAEQEKQFDEIIVKYQKIAEEERTSMKESTKPNRIEMFKKMEERSIKQTEEMASFLNEEQLTKYKEFVKKNGRKRPRYNDEIITKIKTEANLDEEQSKILEAANNAFEKAYHDAHDIYHGNSDLAKEYWNKFDEERKNALKSVLSEEQYNKFLEIVKTEEDLNKK